MAKMRDRSKMKVVGTPREEPRPVVSISDPQMWVLVEIPLLDLGYVHLADTEVSCVYKMSLMRVQGKPFLSL